MKRSGVVSDVKLPEERPPVPDAGSQVRSRRPVVAAAVGNFVEFFDYSVYGFFAAVIGSQFFPSLDPTAALLAAFATFGLTFVARPLGAVVFGHFGDRFGRRNTLAVSVLMMGFAVLAIGLLPPYAVLGAWAPALLTLARLVQGFSAGGEAAGSSSFLVEYAPPGRRGLYASWQQVSILAGLLLGSGLAALLGAVLREEAFANWGWRVPFILGAIAALVGLYLRLRLDDTPEFRKLERADAVEPAPISGAVRRHGKLLLTGIGFFVAPTVSTYIVLVYMPTFVTTQFGLPPAQSLTANAIAIALLTVLTPITGALSDRLGRKRLMLGYTVTLAIGTYPLILLISQGSFAAVLTGQLIFVVLMALYYGPGTAMYAEIFPTRIRYTGIGISLGLATALFGGSAPFLSAWLVSVTGEPTTPAFYLIAAAVVTFVAVSRVPETAHSPLST